MDQFTYSEKEKHAQYVLKGLNTSRDEYHSLCDFQIVLENKTFYCHRSVLAIFSNYFRAMFDGQFRESNTNFTEIKNVSETTFQMILDYIYSGEININQATVQDLLQTASRFEFTKVTELCTSYLRHQIDEKNVINILQYAESNGHVELLEATKDFIFEKMESVFTQKSNLAESSEEDMVKILSCNCAHNHGEETIVVAILNWIHYDPNNRKRFVDTLLREVHWPRISVDFVLRKLLQHDLVKTHVDIKKYIVNCVRKATETLQNLNDVENPNSNDEVATSSSVSDNQTVNGFSTRLFNFKPRNTSVSLGRRDKEYSGECLLLIGGLTLGEAERGDTSQPNVMSYNPRTKTWKERHVWQERGLRGFTVTRIQNGVIVTGGCGFVDSNRFLNQRTWKYEAEADSWQQLPDMNFGRAFHGACSLAGEIYVIGGSSKPRMDMETLTLQSATWKLLKCDAPKILSNFTLTQCNGKILLLGCGTRSHSLFLQLFNPSIGQWTTFRSPNVPRHLSTPISAICRSNELIAVCGDNSQKIFIFDPNKNLWTRGADMKNLHSNGGATALGDDIYVTGGHWEGESYWDEMEYYNISTDNWTSIGPLPHLWLYHNCATVYFTQ